MKAGFNGTCLLPASRGQTMSQTANVTSLSVRSCKKTVIVLHFCLLIFGFLLYMCVVEWCAPPSLLPKKTLVVLVKMNPFPKCS